MPETTQRKYCKKKKKKNLCILHTHIYLIIYLYVLDIYLYKILYSLYINTLIGSRPQPLLLLLPPLLHR